jgi:hypothetical protein
VGWGRLWLWLWLWLRLRCRFSFCNRLWLWFWFWFWSADRLWSRFRLGLLRNRFGRGFNSLFRFRSWLFHRLGLRFRLRLRLGLNSLLRFFRRSLLFRFRLCLVRLLLRRRLFRLLDHRLGFRLRHHLSLGFRLRFRRGCRFGRPGEGLFQPAKQTLLPGFRRSFNRLRFRRRFRLRLRFRFWFWFRFRCGQLLLHGIFGRLVLVLLAADAVEQFLEKAQTIRSPPSSPALARVILTRAMLPASTGPPSTSTGTY